MHEEGAILQSDEDIQLSDEKANAPAALNPLADFTVERTCASSGDFFQTLLSEPLSLHEWVFRGQSDSTWPLQPSLERHGANKVIGPAKAERFVTREFKRAAHQYHRTIVEDDELEWLALMRHHGAPTRLLDWTKSPYVAAFFALAEAGEKASSAVWAIDAFSLAREAHRVIEAQNPGCPNVFPWDMGHPIFFKQTFMQRYPAQGYAFVAPVHPSRANERVTVQQGLFLCPCNLHVGFEECLANTFRSAHQGKRLHKLVINRELRVEILQQLQRMNITYASLFPGLDGFGASLGTNLEILGKVGHAMAPGPFD